LAPAQFLLQIEDNPRYVPAEARETAEEFGRALPPIKRAALASCDARVRFGENEPPAATGSDGSVNVFAGWTTLDPSEPVFRSILRAITERVDGFLWDNVHGTFLVSGKAWIEGLPTRRMPTVCVVADDR
jgi:hypothetical protein